MMDYEGRAIIIPPWDGVARNVAELWRMQKDGQLAVCSLWTHPDGAQLRLLIDGKLRSAEASHHSWIWPILAAGWQERLNWLEGWN